MVVTCMMPVGETQPDEGVPPLVRAPPDIELPGPDNLRELGDIEEEGEEDEEIEDDDPREEDLDLVTVEAGHEGPVNGGDKPVHHEGGEIEKPDHDVLVLVHLLPEDHSARDEAEHREHVDSTECGVAPERVVNSCKLQNEKFHGRIN